MRGEERMAKGIPEVAVENEDEISRTLGHRLLGDLKFIICHWENKKLNPARTGSYMIKAMSPENLVRF